MTDTQSMRAENEPYLQDEIKRLHKMLDELRDNAARTESVVHTAILVVTAFRLRDGDALVMTLNRLADSVDALEPRP